VHLYGLPVVFFGLPGLPGLPVKEKENKIISTLKNEEFD